MRSISPQVSLHHRLLLAVVTFAVALPIFASVALAQTSGAYKVTNLVSDGSVPATLTDTNFINPWAISDSGTWWISTAGSGYNYVISTVPAIAFKVIVPTAAAPNTGNGFPAGSVTTAGSAGMILPNGTKASFLFSTLDGSISGWNGKLGTANALSQVVINNSSAGASYPGMAIINTATASYVLAANFGTGNKIEVYDSTFKPTTLAGSFSDPSLPAGYAPFSVRVLNGQVWVAYALRTSAAPYRTVDAMGNGAVSVFDLSGNFVARAVTGGNLDSPWGVAFAPTGFGVFGGSLLIGNFGNGLIDAYDPKTYAYRGQLADNTGKPIAYASLWELLAGGTAVGNTTSVSGGDPNSLYFTAGLTGEAHGLFGVIANDSTTVGTPTYGVSASAGALTVADGSSGNVTVSVAPIYGFSGTVTFTCSGLPVAASCSFSPAQVSALATAPTSTTVTIQTARFGALAQPLVGGTSRIAFAFLVPFIAIPAFYRRRQAGGTHLLQLVLFCAVAMASMAAITGCATAPMPPSTPVGSSNVVINATSGSISQSTTVALTVQ